MKLACEGRITAYITATTVTNVYYIARKEKGKNNALGFLRDILSFLEVANVNKSVVLDALDLNFNDFEDAIQESSAKNINIAIIITRNEKDFKQSKLTIYNPQSFLNFYISDQFE